MPIYTSPWRAVEIPDLPVADFVLARVRERGSRPALIDPVTGRTITYADLPDRIDAAAASLARRGIGKGDVCGIFSPNSVGYAIAVLAIARLGAVVTTASAMCTADDLARQLRDSRAKLLLTDDGFRLKAEATGVVKGAEATGARIATLDELLIAEAATPPAVSIGPDDLFALPYSSGTTGLPKGVMLSQRNIVANLLQLHGSGHLRDGSETLVVFLPFFHIYGLVVILLLGIWSGATLVVMPRFDMEQYLTLVERHRATVLHVVPPIVLALAKGAAAAGRDLSSVRKLFSGAAPLGGDVIRQCCGRLACALQQGYGLTEASPATHCTGEDGDMDKAGTIGRPVPNTECRIVDPVTREDVEPGQDGEIWVRGPQVMLGYLNQPDATRAMIDEDGWLHTGDIGRADADGDMYVVDRLKELIKYKGMQVPPAELEAVLLSHPSVADAAVVPQADEDAGEIPRAFVVLKGPATAEELMAFVAARVAAYKKIRRLEFIDAIPKSPSGKILRRLLRSVPPRASR